MASKVDNDELVGYLVSCCIKGLGDDYQIMTSARVAKIFPSPHRLYVPLLGKLFHTIAEGHPEPEKLIEKVIEAALGEFRSALKDDSRVQDEFTVVGKF
jgi:hypothetical protein